MSTKHGLTETKELLDFGFKLQKAITDSFADGKLQTLIDAPKFLPALIAAPKAFGGINRVHLEIGDLDEFEKEELMAFVRERFDLPDESLEVLVEDTIDQILSLYKITMRYANLRRK